MLGGSSLNVSVGLTRTTTRSPAMESTSRSMVSRFEPRLHVVLGHLRADVRLHEHGTVRIQAVQQIARVCGLRLLSCSLVTSSRRSKRLMITDALTPTAIATRASTSG